eukprot:1378548-Amphidinium_carterae.1
MLSDEKLQPFVPDGGQHQFGVALTPVIAFRPKDLATENPPPGGPSKRRPPFLSNAHTRSASDGADEGAYRGMESIHAPQGERKPRLQSRLGEGAAHKLQFGTAH